jgi:hypothetical protein
MYGIILGRASSFRPLGNGKVFAQKPWRLVPVVWLAATAGTAVQHHHWQSCLLPAHLPVYGVQRAHLKATPY